MKNGTNLRYPSVSSVATVTTSKSRFSSVAPRPKMSKNKNRILLIVSFVLIQNEFVEKRVRIVSVRLNKQLLSAGRPENRAIGRVRRRLYNLRVSSDRPRGPI